MRAQLIANITKGHLLDSLTGSEFSWPTLQADEDIVLSLRLAREIDGSLGQVTRVIHGWKWSIGPVDARPTSGAIKLKVGSAPVSAGVNTTDAIDFASNGETIAAKLNALSGGFASGQKPVTCEVLNGSWIITAADKSQLTLSVAENTLQPLSRLQIARTQNDAGAWLHDLRLTQYPLCFTDEQARKLPPAPVVTITRDGLTGEGGVKVNQTVEIDFTGGFRGSYYLALMGRETIELQVEDASGNKVDGPVQVQAALNALGAPDGGSFLVTAPRNNVAKIEYTGNYAGQAYTAPVLHIVAAPEGEITSTLSLKRPRLYRYIAAALAAAPTKPVTVPMEIRALLGSETDDDVREWHVLCRVNVEVEPALSTDDLATIPDVPWLRGPEPRDYLLRSADSIATGSQHREKEFGNGTSTEFDWDHALDSDDLLVSLKENIPNGRLLINGTDYEVHFVDSNNLVITMLGAYAATPATTNALRGEVITADQRAAFLAHTHTIDEITGLRTLLDAHDTAIGELQSLIGVGTFASSTTGTADKIVSLNQPFDHFTEIFGRRARTPLTVASFVDYDMTKLPRHGGALFSAIHADSSTTFPVSTFSSGGTVNTLYKNESGGAIKLPPGRSHPGFDLLANEYAAWSGEMWYKVAKHLDSEKTYYPVDFIRDLCEVRLFSPHMFITGFELGLRVGLEMVALNSDVRFHYVLVIEHGAFTKDTSPATTGSNLDGITWSTTPMLAEPLVLGKTALPGVFGVRIQNKASGLVAKVIAWGNESSAGSVPASNVFALRVRLVRPDTANGQPSAKGFIGLRGLDVQSQGSSNQDDTLGKCVITQI